MGIEGSLVGFADSERRPRILKRATTFGGNSAAPVLEKCSQINCARSTYSPDSNSKRVDTPSEGHPAKENMQAKGLR